MIVYANNFLFEPENGPQQIIHLVARWVGLRAHGFVDAERLSQGIRDLKLRDGSTLSSRATLSDERQITYPYLFCAQLSHRDEKVSGRKWITEVGLRQESSSSPVECSLLLKTDEVSAKVTAPIQVTRPRLVEQLINTCIPSGQTPGLYVKELNEESAPAFLREIERDERDYPIVLISPTRDGEYTVAPERLRSILVGLADVVDVPSYANTFIIADIIGRRYVVFGGAVRIIFPARRGDRGWFCENVLLSPDTIADIIGGGNTLESEVLSVVTHRTNLPSSWRHISQEMVGQAILRAQLTRMIDRAKSGDLSEELAEYIALFETADQELQAKDIELARMRSEYEARDQEARRFESDNVNLKHMLRGLHANDDGNEDLAEAFTQLRDSINSVIRSNPSLQEVLEIVSILYSDRIIVLDSAVNSAKESDKVGFRYGAKACELLFNLVTDYWLALTEGKGDNYAKSVFGQKAYAANESSVLSHDGRRRRTFTYRGREILMEKHLKHGVKDSSAETLRVHFEWLADEKKIVIGHFGKHLDF